MTTRNHVKEIATIMVKESGLINLSRRNLCERAGFPDGSWSQIMDRTFVKFIDELKKDGIDTTGHVVNKSRADPALRKKQILGVAVNMAQEIGYLKITRDAIAENAGVSVGLVTRYFGTMIKLRRAIIRAAIAQGIPEIIAQGLANSDAHAKKAPNELKNEAIKLIVKY